MRAYIHCIIVSVLYEGSNQKEKLNLLGNRNPSQNIKRFVNIAPQGRKCSLNVV